MKKILSIVFALVVMLTVSAVIAFAEENTSGVLDNGYCGADGDNLSWTLYKDGELIISGEGEMKDYNDNYSGIEAPWATYKNAIINVVIEKGVTAVGDYSFYCCTKLESILLPETLNTIGIRAFSICFSLKEIVIPEGVTSIGLDAFYSCREIKKITIPSTVTHIGSGIFSGNTKLQKLIFAEGVQTISKGSFSECSTLEYIVLPLSITTIEDNAFANCAEIDTVYFRGTEEQWNNITFGTGNGYLKTAENIVFNAVCHDYESTVVAPTCIEKGYTKYVCKICGDEYIDETTYTEMIPHQITNSQCSVCEKFIVEEYEEISLSVTLVTDSTVTWSLSNENAEIVSTGFSKVSWGSNVNVTASATIKGLAVGISTLTASANGNVISTAEIEIVKHEHNYFIDYFVKPTCTEGGYYVNSCSCGDCFYDGYENYPALGHDMVADEAVAPTCTETGLTAGSHCSRCNDATTVQKVISATGHSYTIVITAPTCTEKGYTTYSCNCGLSFKDDYVNATGHTYSKEIVAPTCTEKGYTIYTCDCGFSDRLDYVNAAGHTYSKEIVAPTCTEKGYTIYTCDCGFSDRLDYVNATGHTPGSWEVVIPAQVDAEGKEQQKCTECGKVLDERSIPALPDDTFTPGDVNGDGKITAADARIVLRISAKLDSMENYNLPLEAFDVTGDGKLNAADARKILRISAKLE